MVIFMAWIPGPCNADPEPAVRWPNLCPPGVDQIRRGSQIRNTRDGLRRCPEYPGETHQGTVTVENWLFPAVEHQTLYERKIMEQSAQVLRAFQKDCGARFARPAANIERTE